MKQKITIKVEMDCDKCRNKALKIAAEVRGVSSVGIEGDEKNKVVVTGEGVDTVCLGKQLKKKFSHVTVLTVEEVKPKPAEPKKDDKKCKWCTTVCIVPTSTPSPCTKCHSHGCGGACRACSKCHSHKCGGECKACSKCHSQGCGGACRTCSKCRSHQCGGECKECSKCHSHKCDGDCCDVRLPWQCSGQCPPWFPCPKCCIKWPAPPCPPPSDCGYRVVYDPYPDACSMQ